MSFYNENEKRKIIMDYYMNKRNRVDHFENDEYKKVYFHSPSCADEINLYFKSDFSDFKMVLKGCAIFSSSCEIFVELIQKKGIENKNKLIDLFRKLVDKKEQITNQDKEFLEKLNIYENVSKHLNRKECALSITQVFEEINNF